MSGGRGQKQVGKLEVGVSQNYAYFLGGSYKKGYGNMGSILGSLYLGKLPGRKFKVRCPLGQSHLHKEVPDSGHKPRCPRKEGHGSSLLVGFWAEVITGKVFRGLQP